MAERTRTKRIFLSAAEPSADHHCANLIRALKATGANFEFVGVGGQQMESAGCELLERTADKAAMINNAFVHIGRFYNLIRRIRAYFRKSPPDIVIVCDSPAFNFHVARAAKKMGITTVFYVAPQLWAWAPWRIGKLRRLCDKLCCILPFEQNYFSSRGVDASFVGNPLLDQTHDDLTSNIKRYDDADQKGYRLALLPGSRDAEIAQLWEPIQRIAMRIRQYYPNVKFVTTAVDAEREQVLRERQLEGFECEYSLGRVYQTCLQSDFALTASGSATLEVAAAGCPMAVMYQSNRLMWYCVGRWLVRLEHFSLVNILAGSELVAEFMPYFTSIEPIVEHVRKMLANPEQLRGVSEKLIQITATLKQHKASETTANIIREMLGEKH